VCEGPFDVLAVASTGRWAAVAPCGTALTLCVNLS
jgi:DNA primase